LIKHAQKIIVRDVSIKVTEENAIAIDDWRENKIDGSNTEYFVQKSWDWFLFDLNSDGDVNTSDAEVWLYDSADDSKTAATVSAIDEVGKITLSSAPAEATDYVKITYRYAPVSIDDPLVNTACTLLTAAYCYLKLRADEADTIGLGPIRVSFKSKTFDSYFKQYQDVVYSIKKLPRRVDKIRRTG